jgi:hypothetical protein
MEMTFPHFGLRQDSDSRVGHEQLVAMLIAQQANSRTVSAVRQAERLVHQCGDQAELRMHYFGDRRPQNFAVRGAFWQDSKREPTSEQAVYQAGSTNIKVRELEADGTGEQLNHAGHGAVRKL